MSTCFDTTPHTFDYHLNVVGVCVFFWCFVVAVPSAQMHRLILVRFVSPRARKKVLDATLLDFQLTNFSIILLASHVRRSNSPHVLRTYSTISSLDDGFFQRCSLNLNNLDVLYTISRQLFDSKNTPSTRPKNDWISAHSVVFLLEKCFLLCISHYYHITANRMIAKLFWRLYQMFTVHVNVGMHCIGWIQIQFARYDVINRQFLNERSFQWIIPPLRIVLPAHTRNMCGL